MIRFSICGAASYACGELLRLMVHHPETQVAHLAECVLEGRKAPVATATERLLETHDGLAIINDIFVPILDVVGQKYCLLYTSDAADEL